MDETSSARLNMVESQVRTADVTDLRIQDAMRRIPREKLLPSDRAYLAYADTEPEYAPGRWLLRPRDVAKLIQLALPADGETALAIAAPYAAMLLEAVLSLGGRAVIIERQGPTGRAVVYVKTGEGVGRRTGFDSAPAFLPGLEPQTGFVF